jgi:hypothetical protein
MRVTGDAEYFQAIATLQRYFSQPSLIVQNNVGGGIADFKANADLVLRRLFHETAQPSSISQSHLAGTGWDRVDLAAVELLPFQVRLCLLFQSPESRKKPLNPALSHFQLSNPTFRRQLLAQFLLFLQILTQLNPEEKSKHPRLMLFPPTFSLVAEDVGCWRIMHLSIALC